MPGTQVLGELVEGGAQKEERDKLSEREYHNNDEELDAAMALAALVEGRHHRAPDSERHSERNVDAISWSLRRRRSGSIVVVNEQGSPLHKVREMGNKEDNFLEAGAGKTTTESPAETPSVCGVDQAKVEKAFQQGLMGIAQLLQEERPLIRAPSFPPQLSTNSLLPQLSLASQSSFGGGGGVQSQRSGGGELQPQLSAPSAFLAAIAASLPPTTSQPWSAFPTLANPLSNPISGPPAYPFLERQDGLSSDSPDSPSPKLVNFLPLAKQASEQAHEMAPRGFEEELGAVKQENRELGFGVNEKRTIHSRRKRSAPDECEDPDPVKEAQRLRRIQANRESARKTIMRKQALCKNLSSEAERLGDENRDLKSKVEATHLTLQRLLREQAKLREELLAAHSERADPLDAQPSTSVPLLPDLSDERRSIEGLPKPSVQGSLADWEKRDAEMGRLATLRASKGSLDAIPEGMFPDRGREEERLSLERLSEGHRTISTGTPDMSHSMEHSIKSGEGSNVRKGESNEGPDTPTDRLLVKTGSNESVSGEFPLKEESRQLLSRQDTASLLTLLGSGTTLEKEAPIGKTNEVGGSIVRALGEREREPVRKAEASSSLARSTAHVGMSLSPPLAAMRSVSSQDPKSEMPLDVETEPPSLPLSLSLLQSIASELRSDPSRGETPQPLKSALSLPPKPQDAWLSLHPQGLQRHLSAPKELIQRQLADLDSSQASDGLLASGDAGSKQGSVGADLMLGNRLWQQDGLQKGPSSGEEDAFARLQLPSGQGSWDMQSWDELTRAGSGVGLWDGKEPPSASGPVIRSQPAAKPEANLYSLYSRGGGRRGSVSLHIGPLPVVDAVTAAEARKRRREVTKSKFRVSGGSGTKVFKVSNAKAAR